MTEFLKIDSRNKKPALWNLAVLSGIVTVLVIFLVSGEEGKNSLAVCVLLDFYFLSVIILLVITFFRQLEYNPYSYNTIYYMGFALFFVYVLVTHVFLTVRMIRFPEIYNEEHIAYVLLVSARNYMILTFPFILVFSVALCVSNICLIRHEGKRVVNILGIILSFLLLAGEAFLFLFDHYVSGSRREVRIYELSSRLFAAVYLYFECMLVGAIIANVLAALIEPEPDRDYLIILGCGIRKDGTPSPLLRGRVEKAVDFYRKQKEKTGKELIFVTSGGQGPDEVISESACMKKCLLENGIPEDRIIEEDRSTSTFENMKFSKEKILEAGPGGKVGFATTNYHVFRSGLLARRVKMRAVGMGSDTKWYFWPNASVREFAGLLAAHRLKQALIFGGMAAIYTILTFIVYR